MEANYELKDGVLHAVITGVYGAREALENRDNVARLITETGARRGLVDLRGAASFTSTLDIYEVNSSIEGFIPKDTRFAFVLPKDFPQELLDFSENVLVNQGYDARMFTDADEALAWVNAQG